LEEFDKIGALIAIPVDMPHLAVPSLPHPLPQPHKEDAAGENDYEEATSHSQRMDMNMDLNRVRRTEGPRRQKNHPHNKERTSIVGVIVKLLENRAEPSSNNGMSATMSMMFMQQIEALNKSMDKQDQKEQHNKRREKKHHKKQHAKKKAKKSKKMTALEGLNDHGGKARGGGR
jgi:hypothetical protein